MKKLTSLTFFLFSIAVHAQQTVGVTIGGLRFQLPAKSSVVYNEMYTSTPSFGATWPGGVWREPTAHSPFRIVYCNEKIIGGSTNGHAYHALKEAAQYQYQLQALSKTVDSTFKIAEGGKVELYIIESRGYSKNEQKLCVATSYAIMNVESDSIFFGGYSSTDIVKGMSVIKTIRSILLNAQTAIGKLSASPSYSSTPTYSAAPASKPIPVNKKNPATQLQNGGVTQSPIYDTNDNAATKNNEGTVSFTMLLRTINGTSAKVVLPQGSLSIINEDHLLSANYGNVKIQYRVPVLKYTSIDDYVMEMLRPYSGNIRFPENDVPLFKASEEVNNYRIYSYSATVTIGSKRTKFIVWVRTDLLTDTRLTLMVAADPEAPELKEESPKWLIGMLGGFRKRL